MRHWWQLAVKNWLARPGRTLAATLAIALGVAVVVWVTTSYESVRVSIKERVTSWTGKAHLTAQSPMGQWGVIYEEMVGRIREVEHVEKVTPRLVRRVTLVKTKTGNVKEEDPDATVAEMTQVDAVGIDPATEYDFRTYALNFEGDRLAVGDLWGAMIEREVAETLGVGVGDSIFMLRYIRGNTVVFLPEPDQLAVFTVRGIFERRRIGNFYVPSIVVQLRALQDAQSHPNLITTCDVLLDELSTGRLRETADAIIALPRKEYRGFYVETAESKFEELGRAEQQTRFVLMLISLVALFTAFFIILSTVSMGMTERVGELGTLRCVGMTRGQVTGMVLLETAPIGVLGTLAGVPLGLGFAWLCFKLLPLWGAVNMALGAVRWLEVSPEGIALAVVGGFLTTLLGALVPAIQAGRVSPMQASQSAARGTGSGVIWVLAAVGVGFIGVHWAMEAYLDPGLWLNHRAVGLAGMMSIYLGYALLTPLAARTLGKVGVFVAAGVFGIRRQLLADQVERAAMRSGVICCGLMVGLSLIVCVVVHTESIIAGWDFPKDLAEAFVWSPGAVKMSTAEKLKDVKGVKQYMLAQDIFCKVVGDTQEWQTMTKPTFVAGSVQSFSEMLEAKFLEGDRYEARDKLLAGGYVLVTPEFASSRGKHVGDSLGVTLNNRVANFEIAGVVESPALDIAASFFNAEGYLMVAAAGAILGTFDDVKKNFGLDTYSFVMLDFDLPDEPVPADFDPERAIVEGKVGLVELVDPRTMSREDLYRWSRERTVLKEISAAMGAFNPIMGSVRELKKAIDRDLRLATLLFATIPAVALLVAGLGVANLMMANVLSRSKQIAVLRSIGATRWQVMRMVIGEALVLSVIGNAVGAALGLHAAYTVNVMTFKLWGFLPEWQVPLNYIGAALGFTTVVCLIAGVIPARYAARTNIISALQGA